MKNDEAINTVLSERFINDLENLIELRQSDVLRITNNVLVDLFWKIGDAFNNFFVTGEYQDNGESVLAVSYCMIDKYGSFFTKKNLDLMRSLASKYSEASLSAITPYISWEHIVNLLNLNDPAQRLFYARCIVRDRLTPAELKKRMTDDLYKRSQPSMLKFPDYPFFDLRPLKNNGRDLSIENFFKNQSADRFRRLLEPQHNSKQRSSGSNNLSVFEKKMLARVMALCEEFQKFQNAWLNGKFNILSFEIGTKIKEGLSRYNVKKKDQNLLIRRLASHLKTSYGKSFTRSRLFDCINFAEQFTDQTLLVEFAGLITWKHIRILSTISDMETKLFYARLVALRGWSAAYLKNQIKNGDQNQPVDEDIKDSLVTRNIFKNKYFLDFMSGWPVDQDLQSRT